MSTYPAQVDTTEGLLTPSNNIRTKLVGTITPATTSISILSATGLQPLNGVISIDSEVIKYESIGPGPMLLNCVRGFDGTPNTSHTDGADVESRWVAIHHNGLVAAIIATQAALGVSPAGSFSTLVARLADNLPLVISKSLSSDWSFTHARKRLVGLQLWRKTGLNVYEQFTAPVVQEYNPLGSATVSIPLGGDQEGFIVVL
jgi:hypothetical protein